MKIQHRLKPYLKASEIITYLILITAGTLGFMKGNYWGGMVTGACLATIYFSIVGKIIFRKTIQRIDKATRDNIGNIEDLN